MKFDDLKKLVKTANVKITSEMRYSELHSLAEAAARHENILTIVVKSGTLSNFELHALAKVGKSFLTIDLSEY